MSRQAHGFTLIELLIVLVIMSLLLSLVPPLLSSVMPSVTIKALANDLYHDLKYVRNMAVLNGKQTDITLNTLDGIYFSDYKDNGKAASIPSDIKVSVSYPDKHVTQDIENTIRFFADGSSSGAYIKLSSNDQSFTIHIDWLTGKISLLQGGDGEDA